MNNGESFVWMMISFIVSIVFIWWYYDKISVYINIIIHIESNNNKLKEIRNDYVELLQNICYFTSIYY